jgi:hypothetical protein
MVFPPEKFRNTCWLLLTDPTTGGGSDIEVVEMHTPRRTPTAATGNFNRILTVLIVSMAVPLL